MKQNQIALHLSDRDAQGVADLSKLLENGTLKAAPFDPTGVTTLTTKRTALETEIGKTDAAKSAMDDQKDAETVARKELEAAIVSVCNAAYDKANGDLSALAGTEIPLVTKKAIAKLVPPMHPYGTVGDHLGEIDWSWDSLRRNVTYVAEIAESADGPWTQVYIGQRSRFTSSGHTAGQIVYMRVRVISNSEQSDWAEPVRAHAH